jgi:hypothetical protein
LLEDGNVVNGIARWNGVTWDSLGSGVNGFVYSISKFNNELVVGGSFLSIGGLNISRLAKWDGSQWLPFNIGSTNVVNGTVTVIYEYNNELYIGGYFTLINGLLAQGVARFDGITWHAYPNIVPSSGFTAVSDLIIYNNELYVGGNFDGIAGKTDIARFDGTNWISVGGGLLHPFSSVTSFCEYQGKLCVAGSFKVVNGEPGNNIALWDGTSWSQLGTGIGPGGNVQKVESYGSNLYAGGGFVTAGGMTVSHFAKWDGINWSDGGGLFNGAVTALTSVTDELYIGGHFYLVNSDTMRFITQCNLPPVGLSTVDKNNFINVFPNPATDAINIISDEIIEQVSIYQSDGKLISVLRSGLTRSLCIQLDGYKPGIYSIEIKQNEVGVRRKLMILKQ